MADNKTITTLFAKENVDNSYAVAPATKANITYITAENGDDSDVDTEIVKLRNKLNTFPNVLYDTKANWDANLFKIAERNTVYVYVNYKEGQYGVKIGDGTSYLIDTPFIDSYTIDKLDEHINNKDIHILPVERRIWNNKTHTTVSYNDETLTIDII